MSASRVTVSDGLSGLVKLDEAENVVPDAAWHWECDVTHRRWSFYIRPDLCAPDTGERISAYTFEALWKVLAVSSGFVGMPGGESRAVDAWKLVIVLREGDADFARWLTRSPLHTAASQISAPLELARLTELNGL